MKTLKVSFIKKYDIKDLGEIKIIIRWQIHQDLVASTIKIDQSAFIQNLVIKEKFTNCNANIISIKSRLSIKMIDLEDYKKANFYTYQQLIGKLIYLAYSMRPDIAFVVEQLSKHNVNPRSGHLQVAKRVVRYLKGTMNIGLIFGQETINHLPKESLSYGLIRYIDSNFAGDLEDRK